MCYHKMNYEIDKRVPRSGNHVSFALKLRGHHKNEFIPLNVNWTLIGGRGEGPGSYPPVNVTKKRSKLVVLYLAKSFTER